MPDKERICWICARPESKTGRTVADYRKGYCKCVGGCVPYTIEEKAKYYRAWLLNEDRINKEVHSDYRQFAHWLLAHDYSIIDIYVKPLGSRLSFVVFTFVFSADAVKLKQKVFNRQGDIKDRRKRMFGYLSDLTIHEKQLKPLIANLELQKDKKT